MRIMIVDDDVLDTVALTHALKEYKTFICRTPEKALEQRADIAIIDMILAGSMTGDVLCQKIKDKYPGTRTIIYTALDDGGHYIKACATADRVVKKSVDMTAIKNTVKALM